MSILHVKGEISISNQVQEPIISAARELKHSFEAFIEPHRVSLWRYCRSLTGSPWDGEDLFQETLLKAFATLSQIWHPLTPKTYLFRIASNAWVDQMRKNKIQFDTYEEDSIADDAPDILVTREALEILVVGLPPKQAMIVLLMDVFEFSGAETAGMVRMTEGAVYAALRRARTKLKSMRNQEHEQIAVGWSLSTENQKVIDSMLEAMQEGSAERLLGLLDPSYNIDAGPGFQEYSKEETLKGSFGDFGHTVRAEVLTLWEKPVLVVMVLKDDQWLLHDISWQEIDNGKIVRHKSYYFCRELLIEAGRDLNVPVQRTKNPGIDWN